MPISKVRTLLLSASLLLGSSWAFANSSVTSSTALYQAPKKVTSIWSGFVSGSRSTGLYDFKDGTRSDAMDYSLRLNATLNRYYYLRLDTGYSQNLKDQDKSTLADTLLSLRHTPFALGSRLVMSYNLGVTAPTSKDSSKRQNLKGSGRGGVIFAVNPDSLIKGFGVASSLSVARNFHDFETDVNGAGLNQYSSTQSLSLSYDFQVGISLSADIVHLNAISYQGNMKENYQLTEDISYQVNQSLVVSAGHSNSGNALRPNGQDYSYDLYNENSSVVYASLTYIY